MPLGQRSLIEQIKSTWQIYTAIANKPMCAQEITMETGICPKTVRRHVRSLRVIYGIEIEYNAAEYAWRVVNAPQCAVETLEMVMHNAGGAITSTKPEK